MDNFFKSFASLQEDLVLRRTLMLLGLSIFSVFFTHVIGFAGAGGLCTLVLAFLAALGWKTNKVTGMTLMTLIWIKHLDSDLFMEQHYIV